MTISPPPRPWQDWRALQATLVLAVLIHLLLLLAASIFMNKEKEPELRVVARVDVVDHLLRPTPPPKPAPVKRPPPTTKVGISPGTPTKRPSLNPGGGRPKAPGPPRAGTKPAGLPLLTGGNAYPTSTGRGGTGSGGQGGTGDGEGTGDGDGVGDGSGGGDGGGTPEPPPPAGPTPYLAWSSANATEAGMTPPVIRQWGPYNAAASYKITGEARVYMKLALDANGRVTSCQVTRVDLGADNGNSPDQRRLEAQRYLETVVAPSTWTPASKGGQPVAYGTDEYIVDITLTYH